MMDSNFNPRDYEGRVQTGAGNLGAILGFCLPNPAQKFGPGRERERKRSAGTLPRVSALVGVPNYEEGKGPT